MSLSIIELTVVLLVCILVVYSIGISLVTLIDNRLSKVSLNLPKQNVVVKIDDEQINSLSKKRNTPTGYIEHFETRQKKLNSDQVKGFDTNSLVNKEFAYNKDDNRDNVSTLNHENINVNASDYGLTNYGHPNSMSVVDKEIFMFQYPSNMTLQDYINWLWCFNKREKLLTYIHLRNLNTLKKGGKLKYEEGITPPPQLENPPLTSQGYFQKLYKNNKINLAVPLNTTTGGLLAYNYGDYSDFTQNQRTDGLSGQLNTQVKDNITRIENLMTPYLQPTSYANITK